MIMGLHNMSGDEFCGPTCPNVSAPKYSLWPCMTHNSSQSIENNLKCIIILYCVDYLTYMGDIPSFIFYSFGNYSSHSCVNCCCNFEFSNKHLEDPFEQWIFWWGIWIEMLLKIVYYTLHVLTNTLWGSL
jgi:hypothetical protein